MKKPVAPKSVPSPSRSWWRRPFDPIDGASLAIFRIAFGSMMFIEVLRYFGSGWIPTYYIEPEFHFRYYGFQWVHPWPGIGMYVHFVALGLLSLFIAFGFFYRLSATLFFFGFTYIFLLDQANYLNHFYMISLVSFMMIFLPAQRLWSWDAKRHPSLASNWIPRWPVTWLRFQLGIVYFLGGVAKLNADWLQGEPMRSWLRTYRDWWLIGPHVEKEWMVFLFTYGGLFFDLAVVPALMWKKTRWIAFLAALSFHGINATIFNIGIFPPLMAAATLLFFSPSWPRVLWSKLVIKKPWSISTSPPPRTPQSRSRCILAGLLVYGLIQVVVPFRHWLYPGNVSWTEEGHNFSWHMKLRDKQGSIVFYAVDPVSKLARVINAQSYLSPRQFRKMAGRPDMVVRFAKHLQGRLADEIPQAEIYVNTKIALNGRRPATLIDPKTDLTKVELDLWPKDWLLPLEEPLRR